MGLPEMVARPHSVQPGPIQRVARHEPHLHWTSMRRVSHEPGLSPERAADGRVLPAGGSSHSSEPLILFLTHRSEKWAESDNHLQQLFYHPVQRCVYT